MTHTISFNHYNYPEASYNCCPHSEGIYNIYKILPISEPFLGLDIQSNLPEDNLICMECPHDRA